MNKIRVRIFNDLEVQIINNVFLYIYISFFFYIQIFKTSFSSFFLKTLMINLVQKPHKLSRNKQMYLLQLLHRVGGQRKGEKNGDKMEIKKWNR